MPPEQNIRLYFYNGAPGSIDRPVTPRAILVLEACLGLRLAGEPNGAGPAAGGVGARHQGRGWRRLLPLGLELSLRAPVPWIRIHHIPYKRRWLLHQLPLQAAGRQLPRPLLWQQLPKLLS